MNRRRNFHGRVTERPAPEVVDHINALMMANSLRAFTGLIRYHRAYVIMLTGCRMLPKTTSSTLLRALRRIEAKGTGALCLDCGRHEELQPALEAWVVDQVGMDHGGQLNAGRSRQECQMVAEQIVLRDELLELIDQVIALAESDDQFISRGRNEEIGPLLKHVPRLLRCYHEINTSRAGVGSIVPTSFYIDRDVLARLLGFSGYMQNSLYGYSAFDIEITLLSVLQLFAADLNRYALTLCRHDPALHGDVVGCAANAMQEAERARSVACNLYLDTTPMIRGAITFATHYCLLVVERLRMLLTALEPRVRPQSRRSPRRTSSGGVAEIKSWKPCLVRSIGSVRREQLRLHRAETALERQVSRVIRSSSGRRSRSQ